MGVTITTRVSDEIAKEITSISKIEHLDRSAVIRRLLVKAVKEWKINKSLKDYANGKITLWKAAEISDISLSEMIDLAAKKNIPVQYTTEDLIEDFNAVIN